MNTEEKKQSRLTKKQKRNIIIVIIVLVVMVLADFVWSNTYIEVKKLSAHFDNLPEGFEGCKIVQISDFHNEWGKGYIDRLTNDTCYRCKYHIIPLPFSFCLQL